jgi:protein-S-isoprenylcysteine O-methyltransferase Ste14
MSRAAALASLGGLALIARVGLLLFFAILRRSVEEDRILREQLEGYAASARKVRYRLIPGVW